MRLKVTLATVAALLFVALAGPAQGQQTLSSTSAPIRLRAATFNPGLGERPAIPPGLADRGDRPAGARGSYLVQLRGPVTEAAKQALAGAGAELLDYIPDNAFKVRMTAADAIKISQLADVAYVGAFHPAYKIDPAAASASGMQMLRVSLDRGASPAGVIGLGLPTTALSDSALIVAADAAGLAAIAALDGVAWVEPLALNQKHDEYARTIIGAVAANSQHESNPSLAYDGSTQIAAVADTGIGGGTAATAHPDIPAGRIVAIYNWPGVTDSCFQTIQNDGSIDVDSGHGTHVAGSVLSDGTNSPAGANKGIAPAARLVFQSTENYVITSSLCKSLYGYANDYYLTGLNDLAGLFQQAYNAGARVHANSWGSAAAGAYTANSVTADQFIWTNRDMTITFSAGNEGADANADGVVDNDSIGAPATAKNVITIGASENDRQGNYQCDLSLTYTSRDTAYQSGQTCASMGGQNQLGTPRQRWGFTANPVADDLTAGNAQQMAAFSSRGPTDDGRIKPDIVAPGTWILSTYSGQYREGYDAAANPVNGSYQSDGWGMPRNAYYKYFGGTSMSNPIAAGAAVVVRDFYQKKYTVNASSALVKATLINTAVDLLDENNDGVNDNDFPIPNVHEGWGRINLDNATDASERFFDVTPGVSTGGSRTYSVTTGASAGPLKITLVWSDYPAAANAAVTLVNNLNLTVSGPGSVTYLGNVFSGGWSATGGSADARNNVENVFVQAAQANSTYTITVSGANVPQGGSQPFALVVSGASGVTDTTPAAPAAPTGLTATAISRTQINLSWADVSGETGYKIERCQGSTCTNFTQIATVGANVTTYSSTGLSRNTVYRYRVRATNAGGDSGYSNIASAQTTR